MAVKNDATQLVRGMARPKNCLADKFRVLTPIRHRSLLVVHTRCVDHLHRWRADVSLGSSWVSNNCGLNFLLYQAEGFSSFLWIFSDFFLLFKPSWENSEWKTDRFYFFHATAPLVLDFWLWEWNTKANLGSHPGVWQGSYSWHLKQAQTAWCSSISLDEGAGRAGSLFLTRDWKIRAQYRWEWCFWLWWCNWPQYSPHAHIQTPYIHTHTHTTEQSGIKSEHLQTARMEIDGICSYWSGKHWPLLAHRSEMENWNSHLLIQSRYYICFKMRLVQTGCESTRARPCYPPWRLERKEGGHNLVRTICTDKETKRAHPFKRNQ